MTTVLQLVTMLAECATTKTFDQEGSRLHGVELWICPTKLGSQTDEAVRATARAASVRPGPTDSREVSGILSRDVCQVYAINLRGSYVE